ncbi:hypothetical protein [Streptomyces sp. NPDC096339]|uniref:hypothetical protein n=1 Tax=Streptomyces sp. NPDC096339 TaxID=3366086 RepID=UPI00380ADFB3
MPQLVHIGAEELPTHLKTTVLPGGRARRWRVAALVVHHDRETGHETGRVALLQGVGTGGGREWEVELGSLYETAEAET